MEMTAQFDRKLIAAGTASSRYLLASIRVPAGKQRARTPVNLTLVLDRSGSMAGAKIAETLSAAAQALRLLRENDHFALVVYDDVIDVLADYGPATSDRLAQAGRLLRQVNARNGTALFDGWIAGCREAAKGVRADTVSRVLLLTDGQANEGETNPAVITRHASELRERGVNTSTLGFGADFNEFLLGPMADAGGGHFHFVEGPGDVDRVMQQEVGDSLEVVARETRLIIEAPAGVSLESLNGFTVSGGAARLELRIGDLNAGQQLACGFMVNIPGESLAKALPFTLRLLDAEGRVLAEANTSLSYASAQEVEQQACDSRVLEEALELRAAMAKRQAYRYNAAMRFDLASAALQAVAHECRQAAQRFELPALLRLAQDLSKEAERVSGEMDSSYRKSSYSSMGHRSKSRELSGVTRSHFAAGSLVLLCTRSRQLGAAGRAVSALETTLASMRGLPELKLNPEVFRILPRERIAPITPEEETRIALTAQSWVPDSGACLVITDLPLTDNWFAHWHARSSTRIASLAGVEEQAGIDHTAFIAYEALMALVYLFDPHHDERRLAHEEVRACLFDFCADRRDLAVKLQNMELCPVCEQRLAANRVPVDILRRLAGAVRSLALPVRRAAG